MHDNFFKYTCLNKNANFLASIRAEHCFCTPVLLSGMPSIIIDKHHMEILETHYKGTLKSALCLPKDTPDPFVYLISGSLTLSALIHLRQFSLVLQLNRLGPNHSSFKHAVLTLQSNPPLPGPSGQI